MDLAESFLEGASSITFYNPNNGEIVGSLTADEVTLAENILQKGYPYVEGEYGPETYYVVAGRVVNREPVPATLHGFTFVNVPVPSTMTINHQSYTVNEATVELGFDQPGTYHITFSAWPYLDKEFTIENPAQ